MSSRDKLIERYPELEALLKDLPEDTRLVDVDSGTFLTLYVEAGERVLELSYIRRDDGDVQTTLSEIP